MRVIITPRYDGEKIELLVSLGGEPVVAPVTAAETLALIAALTRCLLESRPGNWDSHTYRNL